MFLRRSLLLSLALSLSLVATVSAQQPQNPPSPDQNRPDKMEGMHGRGHGSRGERRRAHRPGFFGLEGELALTDAQKQQLRAIHERNFEGTKSLREELFNLREKRREGTFSDADAERARTLHEQMRASMKAIEAEAEAVLTPAQKAKVEELKQERKQRRAERMGRHESRPNEQ